MSKSKGQATAEKRLRPEISYLEVGGVLVLRMRARIVQDVSEALMDFVSKRDLGPEGRLILNLSEVVYMSSSAIGALVRIGSECRLKLAAPSDAVRKVLELGEILPMFDIASSEEQALADFDAGPGS